MPIEIFLALILFAFVSSITPGPNNIMLMTSGLNYGFLRTVPHMLGVGLGFVFMVVMVGVGVIAVFDLIPASYLWLKVISGVYLVFLAYKIATSSQPVNGRVSNHPMTFLQAALFQWVNPKAWTMALTAISVYAPTGEFKSVLVVAVVFGLVNIPSVSTWVIMGQALSRFLKHVFIYRIFNHSMALLLLLSLYPAFFM